MQMNCTARENTRKKSTLKQVYVFCKFLGNVIGYSRLFVGPRFGGYIIMFYTTDRLAVFLITRGKKYLILYFRLDLIYV